jgi:hypothetical protein
MVNMHDTCKALLVTSIQKGEKTIFWEGLEFVQSIENKGSHKNWFKVHQSIKLSDINLKSSHLKLKVYIWNINRENFYIDNFKLSIRDGNPFLYGLVKEI